MVEDYRQAYEMVEGLRAAAHSCLEQQRRAEADRGKALVDKKDAEDR